MMRAMVFGAEADKLVVQARPEEIRRYTVGEAVAILGEQGWALTPNDTRDFHYPIGVPQYVEVTMRTRCGCTQQRMVHFPPQREIRVAMFRADLKLTAGNASRVDTLVRRFKLERVETHASGARRYEYEEVLE